MPYLMFEKASRGLAALALSTAILAPLTASSAPNMPDPPPYRMGRSLEGNVLAAYVADLSKDTAASAAYYRQALRDSPKSPELMNRALLAYLANNEMADAFRLAERLLQQNKNNELARLALGIRNFHEQEFNAARQEFAATQRGQTPDFGGILLSAWAWTADGQLSKGITTAATLGRNQTFMIYRDYHAGLMALISGKPEDAERLLKAAYEADSKVLRVVDAYGRVLSLSGKTSQAIAVYEEYRKLLPSQPTIRWALGELRAGRTLPPPITNPSEGAAEVLYSLGDAGGVQGDELKAIVYLRLALYLDPQHAMARFSLAEANERLGQFDQSVALLRGVPASSHLSNDAIIQSAYDLEQLGRREEAQATLETLVTADPKNGSVILALATIERARAAKEKDRAKATPLYLAAAANYTKTIELLGAEGRSNWSLLFARATCYERAKQWDKAEADLKQAMSLVPERQSPDRAQVMNYLAYAWVDANQNIDNAFTMLQQAVELSPRDGMIIDSLGWAYYRLGRYQEAVQELEKAVAYKPGDPTINDHLGDAYWKVGRQTDARFQWNHARDSNPEADELKKILDKIENGLK